MIGAIIGDVIGSTYESLGQKRYDVPLFTQWSKFTDDTVVTAAVARCLLEGGSYKDHIIELCRRYPQRGYGQSFERWLVNPEIGPYNSWGNGAAMRVSPIGFAADTEAFVLDHAAQSVAMSHNHPQGVKGAQATALAIFLARQGESRETIRTCLEQRFNYDLQREVSDIRPDYTFDVACEKSVPEAIICFLDAGDYETTIRNVLSLGGDTDTMACIAGGIAQAYWNCIPAALIEQTQTRLSEELLNIVECFNTRYNIAPDTTIAVHGALTDD